MKANLKFITLLICLYFAANAAFAQSKKTIKKAFIGIWELSMSSTNGQPLQNTGPGYLKMFNTDGTFANVQMQNTGAVISHSGKYAIDNAQTYTEGQDFKMNYAFSEDKKQVTFNFSFKDGTAFTEVWRRL